MRFRCLFLLVGLLLGAMLPALAHPMPNTLLVLDLQPGGVAAELQLPLTELQPAFGHDVLSRPSQVVADYGPALRRYLQQHTRPIGPDGRAWTVRVGELRVQAAEQTATGPYQELTAQLWLQPPPGATARTFTLHYDAIVHQVVTHVVLVALRRDWAAGRVTADAPTEVGTIRLDIRRNVVPPLRIDQGVVAGGWGAGLRGMVLLGMRHIAEGADHLLFLLALLLPAPLRVAGRRWGAFGGGRYSLGRLLRIVTAFTLGHSLTLLLGALGWVQLPAQPVEVLIAASVLVSAGHALRPLFAGREALVAGGFGLVHGLAFASTLAGLQLPPGPLVLSILGFNVGIELMQLLVIGAVGPGLLLLARSAHYTRLRVAGAVCAGVAALSWLVERTLPAAAAGPWPVLHSLAVVAPWLLLVLLGLAAYDYWRRRRSMPAA